MWALVDLRSGGICINSLTDHMPQLESFGRSTPPKKYLANHLSWDIDIYKPVLVNVTVEIATDEKK